MRHVRHVRHVRCERGWTNRTTLCMVQLRGVYEAHHTHSMLCMVGLAHAVYGRRRRFRSFRRPYGDVGCGLCVRS